MRTSECNTQKLNHIIITERGKGSEREKIDRENGNGNVRETEKGNGGKGKESEKEKENGTKNANEGKRSGNENEPREMKKTGSTETGTEKKSEKKKRKNQNLDPLNHQAVSLNHQRRKPHQLAHKLKEQMNGRILGGDLSPLRRNLACPFLRAVHGGVEKRLPRQHLHPIPPGHHLVHHHTLVLAPHDPGPGPHPTAPILVGLLDTAHSQAADPGLGLFHLPLLHHQHRPHINLL